MVKGQPRTCIAYDDVKSVCLLLNLVCCFLRTFYVCQITFYKLDPAVIFAQSDTRPAPPLVF